MISRIKKDLETLYQAKPHRLDHVYGVVDMAQTLGERHHCDLKKLTVAGLLHDITKYYTHEQHLEAIRSYFDNAEEIIKEFHPNILHAFSAVVVANQQYGVTDKDILNAIQHHTVGAPNMSIYEEIIFISDYIEPNRTYESCIRVRPIAFESLHQAIYMAIDDSITYNESVHGTIPNIAYLAREYYKQKLEESEWKK